MFSRAGINCVQVYVFVITSRFYGKDGIDMLIRMLQTCLLVHITELSVQLYRYNMYSQIHLSVTDRGMPLMCTLTPLSGLSGEPSV